MASTLQTRHNKADIQARFLESFRVYANISAACRVAGVSRPTIYEWQEHDEQFAAEFKLAEVASTESLEREAYRRAVEGVDKPVFQGKELVGTIREYSDTLLIVLLKARRPDVYRERLDVTTREVAQKVLAEQAWDAV